MKRTILMLLILVSTFALGQDGFKPVSFGQKTLTFTYLTGFVGMKGHWEGGDLAGPSTSTISCYRDRMICTDDNAQLVVSGNTLNLSGEQTIYKIERWNRHEIVSSNIGGLCMVRNVIKIDLVQKRVFYTQTQSEPDPSAPAVCNPKNLVGLSELKDGTSFTQDLLPGRKQNDPLGIR